MEKGFTPEELQLSGMTVHLAVAKRTSIRP
jgi:hypothetical protein